MQITIKLADSPLRKLPPIQQDDASPVKRRQLVQPVKAAPMTTKRVFPQLSRVSTPKDVVKLNLARTGTEHPLMLIEHKFISCTPEYEPLAEKCPQPVIEEYMRNHFDRCQSSFQVIYDYTATSSPFYTDEPYIDDSQAIELVPLFVQDESPMSDKTLKYSQQQKEYPSETSSKK